MAKQVEIAEVKQATQPEARAKKYDNAFALPMSKTKPVFDMSKLKMLLYGAPKIGKSTFCSQIPNALFLSTEDGLNHLSVYEMTISKWEDIQAVGALLATSNHGYKTLIIDTADSALTMCERFIAERKGVSHILDLKWNGPEFVADEFMRVVQKLSNLGLGMVFLAHSEDKVIRKKNESDENRTVITLQKSTKDRLTAFCDIIAFATVENMKNETTGGYEKTRVIKTQPSRVYEAGDRTNKLTNNIALNYGVFANLLQG